jgi:Domain of unknown function (DUF1858).
MTEWLSVNKLYCFVVRIKQERILMNKIINLSKSVYDNCNNNPEAIEIMKELGFNEIAKPAMLNTAGRFMTIAKGAEMKGISLDKVRESFTSKGYEVIS